MEQHTQGVDDHLIESLSFRPKPAAGYVIKTIGDNRETEKVETP